jgi:predicted MPP superfamily phosphohydrolase
MLCVFLYYENNALDITEYEIKSENAGDKLLIAHLSDLHSKPFEKVVNTLDERKPDIIVITGDYINDKCKKRDKMLEFGKRLVSVAPVVYITGNHERRLENFDKLMNELSQIGFKVLLNECCYISLKSTSLSFLGLDENQADFEDYKARKNGTFVYRDMSPYFREFEKYKGYKIVLSHFPENFKAIPEMNYSQYDFDLQLSGHAHGGQFIIPFFGPVFSPGQGIRPKYARGSFGERPKLIVSRGLGNAEFPFRLFNHPEINMITINRKETD